MPLHACAAPAQLASPAACSLGASPARATMTPYSQRGPVAFSGQARSPVTQAATPMNSQAHNMFAAEEFPMIALQLQHRC